MNENNLLEALRANPSPEVVERVFAWLEQTSPADLKTKNVASTIAETPDFDPHLERFQRWIGTGLAVCLGQIARYSKSEKVIDWLLALVRANPDHLQAGEIWEELVQRFADEALEAEAAEWLLKHSDNTEVLLGRLIQHSSDPRLLSLARQLVSGDKPSFTILSALAAHPVDESLIECALRYVKSKEHFITKAFVLGAYLRLDDRFGSVLKSLLKQNANKRYVPTALAQIYRDSPDATAPLLCAWLEKNLDNLEAETLMFDVCMSEPEQELTDLAWAWLEKNPKTQMASAMVSNLVHNKSAIPPEAAVALYECEGSKERAAHESFTAMLNSVPQAERYQIASQALRDASPERRCEILRSMLQTSSGGDTVELSKRWLLDYVGHTMSFVLARDLYQAGDAETKKFVKEYWTKHERRSFFECFLIDNGDEETIAAVKARLQRVAGRRIPRYVGLTPYALSLKQLLNVCSKDSEVHELARQFLARRILPHEYESHERLRLQYESVINPDVARVAVFLGKVKASLLEAVAKKMPVWIPDTPLHRTIHIRLKTGELKEIVFFNHANGAPEDQLIAILPEVDRYPAEHNLKAWQEFNIYGISFKIAHDALGSNPDCEVEVNKIGFTVRRKTS
ncbi:MAG TPA: hypothetical protein V6C81_07860 [Planktothrix sp.]|jgi:hypothetical protein